MINSILLKVTYIGGTLIGNLTLFSMYLLAANNLILVDMAAKIIVVCNFFIIEMVLFIRRVIFKNNDYITSVKQGKHNKFVKIDIITSIFITIVSIYISKYIDSNLSQFMAQSYDKKLVAVSGIFLSSIGIVVYVTSIANYMYTIKKS